MSIDRCWSCRAPLDGAVLCPECGEHRDRSPSVMSKRHPGRLDFRAVLILVVLVPTLGWKAFTELSAGNGGDAALFGGLGVVALLFSGLHLWVRYRR